MCLKGCAEFGLDCKIFGTTSKNVRELITDEEVAEDLKKEKGQLKKSVLKKTRKMSEKEKKKTKMNENLLSSMTVKKSKAGKK